MMETREHAYHIHNEATEGKESIVSLRKGPNGKVWDRSLANEGRRLAQGIGKNNSGQKRVRGTNTTFFTKKDKIPKGRKITYANFICDYRPKKEEKRRVRLTAGGDKLDYPGNLGSPTVSMIDVNLHLNSVISDAKDDTRCMCMDIKDFYLGTPMDYYQYMRIRKQHIPEEVIQEYNIVFDETGRTYCEVRRGV